MFTSGRRSEASPDREYAPDRSCDTAGREATQRCRAGWTFGGEKAVTSPVKDDRLPAQSRKPRRCWLRPPLLDFAPRRRDLRRGHGEATIRGPDADPDESRSHSRWEHAVPMPLPNLATVIGLAAALIGVPGPRLGMWRARSPGTVALPS